MCIPLKIVVACGLATLLGSDAFAQATGSWQDQFPRPVRHVEPVPQAERGQLVKPAQHLEVASTGAWQGRVPSVPLPTTGLHPHRVIQHPGKTTKKHARHLEEFRDQSPHLSFHHQVKARPPSLPQASRRETWKTPYSYGYFGASAKRQWSRHHGYRDRYTEWRLR